MKWSKMLTNLLANATSAILDLPPAEIFAHPGLYRLEIRQLRETLRVMAALGVRPVDLPGTPVRLLAYGVQRLPLAVSRPLLRRAVGGGRGAKMPSFHIDLHSGRGKSEVDYLNGAVVRFGDRLGIPTPANRLLNETLLALSEGRLPLDAYAGKPEKFLEEKGNRGIGKSDQRLGTSDQEAIPGRLSPVASLSPTLPSPLSPLPPHKTAAAARRANRSRCGPPVVDCGPIQGFRRVSVQGEQRLGGFDPVSHFVMNDDPHRVVDGIAFPGPAGPQHDGRFPDDTGVDPLQVARAGAGTVSTNRAPGRRSGFST
jgi:hypothetical protein